MKKLFCIVVSLLAVQIVFAQITVPIPATLEGSIFNLKVQKGTSEIFPGQRTNTIGYNGAQLGPTLILQKGETVTINVDNQLDDTTTVHWHGLHLSPANDGGPHTPIMAGNTWSPSFKVMDQASTYWYHPHLHRKTLNQVVKGAAGFIIVHDPAEASLNLPRTYGVDDVPLVFQWKTFDESKQIVEMDEVDNEVLVNGVLKGATLNLPAQVVRLRLLNGSSHRYFNFGFSNNLEFKQIAGDGGLLDAPVAMTKLILAPGERAEVLLDLSKSLGQKLLLQHFGTELPMGYPGGMMMMMGSTENMMGPLDDTDFDLMQIQVLAPTPNAIGSIPPALITNTPLSSNGAFNRDLTMSARPQMSMTNFFLNESKFEMNTINFKVSKGAAEVWTLTNQTMMAHPFHLHGNSFWVISVNNRKPAANLLGRKDVITVPPINGAVKIVVRYDDFSDSVTPYMYHCHILSHEDNGMMGQFLVAPLLSGTHDNLSKEKLKFYPNPADKMLVFEISEKSLEKAKFQVIDVMGRVVLEQQIQVINGQGNIPVEQLIPGTYTANMFLLGKLYAGVFIKQ